MPHPVRQPPAKISYWASFDSLFRLHCSAVIMEARHDESWLRL